MILSTLNRESQVFPLHVARFFTGDEKIMRGNRDMFPLVPRGFHKVNQIGFLGWGSQSPAQSQNLRDTLALAKSDIKVVVGLRGDSESIGKAKAAGFTGENGTLGEMYDVASKSDVVIMLISDAAQTENWRRVTAAMKGGATLGLSHGFLLGHLKSTGEKFREDINVILMAPKGMGPSVRKLYLQGAEKEGAGINSSIAVHQDINGRALDQALAWALGTGSPATFFTTMENEVRSDLYGERSMLLGALWGLSEAHYDFLIRTGMSPELAFMQSAKGLTDTVSKAISAYGLLGAYRHFEEMGSGVPFENAYRRAYPVMDSIMREIYAEVASWREIKDVVAATRALKEVPMSNIETADMWRIAHERDLYGKTPQHSWAVAYAAGAYIAGIMAQMRILCEHGHCTSEIVNESLIEAIDSLNPYMDKRGVSYMVDNCSTTARLGTRKWGPRFKQGLFEAFVARHDPTADGIESFQTDPLHDDIATCFKFRPTTKIAVD